MLVVIPFCRKDEHLVIQNLELCRLMDGTYDFECLLSYDQSCSVDKVLEAAEPIFRRVHKVRYDSWGGGQEWPMPQNWAWQNAARHIWQKFQGEESWLWWEADAVPVQPGWLKTLEERHKSSGRKFTGAIMPVTQHMNGVAIYPVNVVAICPPALMVRKLPFDQMLRESTARMMNPTNDLIQVVLTGNPNFPDQRSIKKTLAHSTVLFHGCKNVSLANRLMEMMDPNRIAITEPDAPSNLTFRHSGPFGDIIYALGVIKAKGGGHLCIGTSPGPRITITKELFDVIAPLAEFQPYIRGVEFDPTSQVDHDLDIFRPILREDNYTFGRTIMSCIAEAAGCGCPPDNAPWLEIDHSVVVDGKPIVINRTVRYRNHKFPWPKIADKYRDKCVFLGTPEEHELMKMQFEWPELKRFSTRTMLDAARVISGCQLFIGNQSSLYAIAEGLKKPVIQEVFLFHADCLFNREHSTHGWDGDIYLPDI